MSTLSPVDDNLQSEPDLSSLFSENEVNIDESICQLESQPEGHDYFNDDLDTSNWEPNDLLGSNQIEISNQSCDHTTTTQPLETCAKSYENVSRLLENYRYSLKSVDKNSTDASVRNKLDALYDVLLKGVSIFDNPDPALDLASFASKSKKRKLTEEDKQIRLISYSKSKAGRKPNKKLRKPSSPEKKDVQNSLMTPTKKKEIVADGSNQNPTIKKKRGRPVKKLDFASFTGDLNTASSLENKAKPKRGRPPKSS